MSCPSLRLLNRGQETPWLRDCYLGLPAYAFDRSCVQWSAEAADICNMVVVSVVFTLTRLRRALWKVRQLLQNRQNHQNRECIQKQVISDNYSTMRSVENVPRGAINNLALILLPISSFPTIGVRISRNKRRALHLLKYSVFCFYARARDHAYKLRDAIA